MKKKLLLLFAALATAVNASAYYFSAENSDSVTIYYNYNGSSSVIVTYMDSNYNSYSGNVVIPDSVTGSDGKKYPVTSIGYNAFYKCTNLTSVTIPNSVTSIGDYAFQNSTGLTSVTIPNSVTTIGEKAFYGCTGLTSATIGNSVTSMGKTVFSDCSGLTSVTIGSAGTTIPDYAFQNDSSLTSVTIPNGVTSIGNLAFNGCSALTSVTIPEGVTSVGYQAFYGCKQLTSVVIPSSVTSIGSTSGDVFSNCSNLTEFISLSTSVPNIGSGCFTSTHSSLKIKVPSASVENYQKAKNWSSDASKIQSISALTDDGTAAYTYNFSLDNCDITYTRNFTKTDWQALFLPFAMSYSNWKDYGVVAELTGVSGNVLEWKTLGEGSSTVAGKPYIFKPKEAKEVTFTVSNATLASCETKNDVPDNGYTLSGTYTTKTDMGDTKAYALSNGNFYYTTNNSKTLKPYRIFLTVPTSSGQAAQIRSRIDGLDVTGIEDVDIDIDVDNQQQFNILGQPVSNDYKGIVIINGKKVIRK